MKHTEASAGVQEKGDESRTHKHTGLPPLTGQEPRAH